MMNYIGQLRVYSLIDLVILLLATKAGTYEFIGALFLHIGFLALLESQHKHAYRKKIPKYLWVILMLVGLVLFGHIEGILFVVCSYLYTLKNEKSYGMYSSFVRGLQVAFLVAGVVGYYSPLTWLAFILTAIRNFCGDLRDVEKDRKENMKTLPIAMGFQKDNKKIHLIALLFTTFVWFQFTHFALWWLLPIFFVQVYVYNLTPR